MMATVRHVTSGTELNKISRRLIFFFLDSVPKKIVVHPSPPPPVLGLLYQEIIPPGAEILSLAETRISPSSVGRISSFGCSN